MYYPLKSLRLALLLIFIASALLIPAKWAVAQSPDDYRLIVTPPLFEFTTVPGDTVTDSLYVYEADSQIVDFEIYNNSDWLFLPIFFTCPETPSLIPFTISTGSLSPGVYYDTITVAIYLNCETWHSEVKVPVMLTVTGGAEYALASMPASFDFVLNQGDSISGESLYIYDVEGNTYNFWTHNNSYWLYVDTMAASPLYTPDLIFLDIMTDTLTPGVYFDTVYVFAEEPDNSPLMIPVSLTVAGDSGDYVVETQPTSFQLNLMQGEFRYDSLFVYETYGRNIPFVFHNRESWLEVDPYFPMPPYATPMTLGVLFKADSLLPGTYIDTIFIEPDSALATFFSPVAVPVFLTVEPQGPVVKAVPDHFSFTLNPGGSAMNMGMLVYEQSGGAVRFTAQTALGSSWLNIHPLDTLSSFWLTPDSLYFDVIATGLTPGVYADTIVIYDPLDDTIPYEDVKVPVILWVSTEQTTIATTPGYFLFTLTEGGSLFNQYLGVYEQSGDTVEFWAEEDVGSGWLKIQPRDSLYPYGRTPDSVIFDIHADTLPPGYYANAIVIFSMLEEGGFEPVKVPVFLDIVAAEPALRAVPDYFDIALCVGDTLDQSVWVYEQNGDSVPFWPVTTLGSSWLYIRDFGTMHVTPDSVSFYVVTTGMAPGIYSDTIAYYDDYQDSLPAKSHTYPHALVPVVLRVLEDTSDYVVETRPTSFNWTVPQGTGIHDTLDVYEKFGRNVIFMFYSSAPWLTVYDPIPMPPYITPMSLHAFADASSLEPGIYIDTIVIQPEYEMFGTVRVPVVLMVQAEQPDYIIDVMPKSFFWPGGWGYDSLLVTERFGRHVGFYATTSQLWVQVLWSEVSEFTTPSWVPLYYHEDTLPAGIYTDTVVITPISGAQPFDTVKVPVVFVIGAEPPYEVRAAPTTFAWTLSQGMPGHDSLHIYEVYGRQIGFLHYNRSDWLTVDPWAMPPFNYVTPRTLPVSVWTDSLTPGVYRDTIFITPDVDSSVFPTVTVPVVLTIACDSVCGDINRDGSLNILDVTSLIRFLYKSGPPPEPVEAADLDNNGTINLMDVTYLINYLYRGGSAPWCQ